MTLLRKTATAVALSFASLGAVAQGAYPCATVKLISPYPPGGTTDISARMIADVLGKEFGQTFVVDGGLTV